MVRASLIAKLVKNLPAMQETLAQFLGQKDPLEKVIPFPVFLSFPGSSESKESACNAGDLVLIPESGRSPGEGNGNPFQYSCLGKSMDRGAWRATVHVVTKSQKRLNNRKHTHTHTHTHEQITSLWGRNKC